MCSSSSRRTAVVDAVNRVLALLTFGVAGMASSSKASESGAPHSFSVMDVNIDPSAERSFEVIVFSLPCNYLGVGALEVSFVLDIARIGDEEFADIG